MIGAGVKAAWAISSSVADQGLRRSRDEGPVQENLLLDSQAGAVLAPITTITTASEDGQAEENAKGAQENRRVEHSALGQNDCDLEGKVVKQKAVVNDERARLRRRVTERLTLQGRIILFCATNDLSAV